MKHRSGRGLLAPVVMTAAVLVALAFAPGAAVADDSDCAMCHEQLAQKFKSQIHGRIQAFETQDGQVGCISCHGDGTEHMDSGGEPDKIRGFGPESDAAAQTALCTTCHRSFELHDWQANTHAMNGVGCADCHKIHADPGQEIFYSETCMSCHPEVSAQFNYPSRHPVREGHMSCTSCHTSHGTSIGLIKAEETLSELCLTCHTQYSGPFIFEHEPIAEGCDTCHAPHGAVADNLLVQNEPFICLQCHELHFHAGLEGEAGESSYVPAYDPDFDPDVERDTYPGGMVPNLGPTSYKQAFTTKCTQCHTAVHGTDLPSQTVPGVGRGLTR